MVMIRLLGRYVEYAEGDWYTHPSVVVDQRRHCGWLFQFALQHAPDGVLKVVEPRWQVETMLVLGVAVSSGGSSGERVEGKQYMIAVVLQYPS